MVILESWTAAINGPHWFFGLDTVFYVLFAIVTMLIYFSSARAFKFAKAFKSEQDRKYKNFGLAFLFLAFAYLVFALSNLALYTGFYDGVVRGINFASLFYLAHIFFMLIGYCVLLLVSLRVKNKKLAVLMFAFMLMFIAFAYQYYLKFHLVSLMLLVFIAYQFWENCLKQKSFNAGLVFVTFYCLGVAELFYLGLMIMPSFYVLAHLMQLTGFLAILWMYARVLKNG